MQMNGAKSRCSPRVKRNGCANILSCLYGVPTDDTYRIVIGNIDTQLFSHATMHMLLETVDKIIVLAEKEHRDVTVQEYYIIGETDWYSKKDKWKGLESFGMVHKTLKKLDKTIISWGCSIVQLFKRHYTRKVCELLKLVGR